MKSIKTLTNKLIFKVQKHSPEILVVTGVVAVVAGTVMACKATTKAADILEEHRERMDKVHTCTEETGYAAEYSEEDARKDTVIVYTKTALKMVKLYAPAVALEVLGITAMLASNDILRKRNVALSAAYAAVEHSFKKYRERVIDRFGDEIEKQIRYDIKAVEIEETVTADDGSETTEKKSVDICNIEGYSPYAVFFDVGNPNWEKDAEMNKVFLLQQQSHANDILRIKGRLFLNDVYEMLGIPRTKAGQVVGWVYDLDNPIGDNYVDFGIFDANKQTARDFVNGYERSILLDFNVDGNIWELM